MGTVRDQVALNRRMAAGSLGFRELAGRQHVSPRELQFASRAITQGGRQRAGRVRAAEGDCPAQAVYEFVTGCTIGQMPFDLSPNGKWQFEIHVVRKQCENVLATLRML